MLTHLDLVPPVWATKFFFAPVHVVLQPCRSSVSVVCQVFCGLPSGLLPSSGIHLMAAFAGLSHHMTGQSHPPCFHCFRRGFSPDLLICSPSLAWPLHDIHRMHCQWKTSKMLRVCVVDVQASQA